VGLPLLQFGDPYTLQRYRTFILNNKSYIQVRYEMAGPTAAAGVEIALSHCLGPLSRSGGITRRAHFLGAEGIVLCHSLNLSASWSRSPSTGEAIVTAT
jgi:hypothetical protein